MSFYVTSKPATSENRHDRFHVCPPEGSSAAGYDLTHKNLEHAQEILANAREFSKISEGFASKIRALLAKFGLDALKCMGLEAHKCPVKCCDWLVLTLIT
jgi:hypothetical protein